LTNGSFIREFSELFSTNITERTVAVISANELGRYMARSDRTLIKIDVEGFEPNLLTAMSGVILQFRPDFILEVLPGSPELLDALPVLSDYDRFLLTTDGPRASGSLFASHFRDWLLRARPVVAA
jgi:hypothetical protein